jgi:hypothetical protein
VSVFDFDETSASFVVQNNKNNKKKSKNLAVLSCGYEKRQVIVKKTKLKKGREVF